MKKSILVITAICMLIMPMNCFASNLSDNMNFSTQSQVLLGMGYTDDGIYYEVYGDQFYPNNTTRVSVTIERTIVFTGDIFPPMSMSWHETMNNLEMTGTLYLDSFYYNQSTNKTIATYSGTVTG